jgi:hypothetical protein
MNSEELPVSLTGKLGLILDNEQLKIKSIHTLTCALFDFRVYCTIVKCVKMLEEHILRTHHVKTFVAVIIWQV